MKQYIGIKLVSAEPMTAGEALDNGYLRVNDKEKVDREQEGYHVVYRDGYNSWSPKNTFESAYKDTLDINLTAIGMMSNDYKDRFIAEYEQVRIRYSNLKKVLKLWENNLLDFTPACERSYYYRQLDAMTSYLNALVARASVEGIALIPYEHTY